MNSGEKDRLRYQISVMQAALDGAEIEYEYDGEDGITWELTGDPAWNWAVTNYRVKQAKNKKIRLEAWLDTLGQLHHMANGSFVATDWTRIPTLDYEAMI